MSLALIVEIIMLLVILGALFYVPPAPYGYGLKGIAALCAIILFLIVVHVIHL